jgi:hypothetical protein
MQQVVDNQIQLDPKAEERMAQATPEQREMGRRSRSTLPRAYSSPIRLWCWGALPFFRSDYGAPSTLSSAARPPTAASLPYGCSPLCRVSSRLVGDSGHLRGRRAGVVQYQELCAYECGAFLNPLEANKALYALASSLDVVTIWTLVLLGMGTAIVAGVKRTRATSRSSDGGRSLC